MSAGEVGLDVLLEVAQSGEGDAARAALSDLLSRLYPSLMGYLVNLAGSKETAEDVCQETMARMVESLPRFTPRPGAAVITSLRPWAFAIATNVYRDFARKSARTTPVASLPEEAASGRRARGREAGHADGREIAYAPAAEDEAISRIARDALAAAVNRLPRDQRNVFLLKVYYGYSYVETGKIVGCPEGTAKSRLHHAVLAVREDMKRRGAL
jgi:RNA polymerase sigma-70 factor (ECF subfamily)